MICITSFIALLYLSKTSTISKSNIFFQDKNLTIDEVDTIQLTCNHEINLTVLESIIEKYSDYYNVVSIDQSENDLMTVVLREIESLKSVQNLKSLIIETFPGASFSFYNSVTS